MNPLELVAVPARAKALLVGLLAAVALSASLASWALLEKVWRVQAQGERDRAMAMLAATASAAKACSAGVDHAKRVGEAAISATVELAAAAKRLNAPRDKEIQRIETIIERPMTKEQAADCSWAWGQIEAERQKRKAGAP